MELVGTEIVPYEWTDLVGTEIVPYEQTKEQGGDIILVLYERTNKQTNEWTNKRTH